MSSLAAAARVVSGARRRLAAAQGLERAADGALGGALLAVAGLVLERFVPELSLGVMWLVLPAAGALTGCLVVLLHPLEAASAALAVDRAAGTHEAFVSALTADDAALSFRELAADHGLRLLGDRTLSELLPLSVPRRAAPALAAAALVAALTVGSSATEADGGVHAARNADFAVAPGGSTAPGARGGETGTTVVPPGPGTAVPVAGSSVSRGTTPEPRIRAEELPQLSEREIESLAHALAERGLAIAERALDALRAGDRATAEAMLRDALSAPGRGGAGGGPAGDEPGGGNSRASIAPGAWSAGAWPLRYDREVRAWLRRQAATDEGGDARMEER